MPKRNSHVMDGTFLLQESVHRPNVKVSEQDEILEMVVMLVVLGIVLTACLVIWWPS